MFARRFYRKTAAPGFYNLRFTPSQGNDNNYVPFTGKFHGPSGTEQTKTNRNPKDFEFNNNLFSLDAKEWGGRSYDYVYQVFKRLHRSNDAWTRTLVSYTAFCFLMAHQALFWKVHLFCFSLFTATRIRDRGAEPTIDEVFILDTIFQHDKLKDLFTADTYHVIDYNQEFDSGSDKTVTSYFPEYKTRVAKFFNTDCNTTSGYYKFGDVESGAMMTLNFKTMPFANNKFHFSEPFFVYDMWAEITHNGEYHVERIIKAEEVLKTKRIFVSWH
jgi:hypothetical protein